MGLCFFVLLVLLVVSVFVSCYGLISMCVCVCSLVVVSLICKCLFVYGLCLFVCDVSLLVV